TSARCKGWRSRSPLCGRSCSAVRPRSASWRAAGAKAATARGDTWRRRLVYGNGGLIGGGWAYLPYRGELTDGSVRESTKSSLAYQYHPDHPEVFDEILAWFEDVTPDALDRYVTPPTVDVETIARLAANGYVIDEVIHADDGDWHQYNRRSLDE